MSASGFESGAASGGSSEPGTSSGVTSRMSLAMVGSCPPPICEGSTIRGDFVGEASMSKSGLKTGGSGTGTAGGSSGAAAVMGAMPDTSSSAS